MRILLALILLAAAIVAGVYFADNPGQVEITWRGWVIDTSLAVLVAVAVLLAFLVSVLALLATGLRRTPAALRRRREASRRRTGETALTRGVVALAAADSAGALRHAERARALLGETPVVLLLAAEAASRQGDVDAARRAYSVLLDRRETEFLGLRGLIGQALRVGDDAAALPLAERARALRPDAQWLTENVLRLQARAGNWREALDTLAAATRRRALPANAARHARGVVLYELSRSAERAGDVRRASALAVQAQQSTPDLVPIACNNARLLLARGHKRAAARAIESAWQIMPHPKLAKLYLEARGTAEPLGAAASLQRLAARNPGAIESHLAIGEAALVARLWGEARRHLTLAAEASAAAPSRRLCLLLARLEESEAGEPKAARQWLDRAIGAPPDSSYVCRRCGTAPPRWHSVCPGCGGFDTLAWQAPENQARIGVSSTTGPAPLMLPAVEAAAPPVDGYGRTSRLAPETQWDNNPTRAAAGTAPIAQR